MRKRGKENDIQPENKSDYDKEKIKEIEKERE